MNQGRSPYCVLCNRSDETMTTGTLLTKDQVTAHQNCLLFSSGIFCKNTPQYDDLFGFAVEDVQKEVKRGAKLFCSHCNGKGATAGCELRRCKKSFHFPCAVEEGARKLENDADGTYGLYCKKHSDQENTSSVKKMKPPKNLSEAGSSRTGCLTCERKEGNICLDSLSNSIIMIYCPKHAPSSQKKKKANGNLSASLLFSSSSNDSSSPTLAPVKRSLSFNELEEEDINLKSKLLKRNRIISDGSSDTDEERLFTPLESHLQDNGNSVQRQELSPHLLNRDVSEKPSDSSAGRLVEHVKVLVINNDDEMLTHSNASSESLLTPMADRLAEFHSNPAPETVTDELPQVNRMEKEVQTIKREIEVWTLLPYKELQEHEPLDPQQSSTAAHPSPERLEPRDPPPSTGCSSDTALGHLTTPASRTPPPSEPSPGRTPPSASPGRRPPSDQKRDMDSASFWKNCNVAGCTQAIFTEFSMEMERISRRIQCDQASQEDYDRALSVMMASGTLADLVTKQEEALQRRQTELQRASAALKDVVSALRK